jgi:hypothetical protein
MTAAEAVWNAYAESGTMTLIGRWNYHNELGAQFPHAPLRIVYAKAGTLPGACLIRGGFVIDHMLYWASPSSEAEGHYLIAIFTRPNGLIKLHLDPGVERRCGDVSPVVIFVFVFHKLLRYESSWRSIPNRSRCICLPPRL